MQTRCEGAAAAMNYLCEAVLKQGDCMRSMVVGRQTHLQTCARASFHALHANCTQSLRLCCTRAVLGGCTQMACGDPTVIPQAIAVLSEVLV